MRGRGSVAEGLWGSVKGSCMYGVKMFLQLVQWKLEAAKWALLLCRRRRICLDNPRTFYDTVTRPVSICALTTGGGPRSKFSNNSDVLV
mmetsp:Transcript_25133/g.49143  ORF Transcript_25133/g.49143 Transcript_25133/m.49143 type:complete len:89 (-) Transcript_25133:974-1240(-)